MITRASTSWWPTQDTLYVIFIYVLVSIATGLAYRNGTAAATPRWSEHRVGNYLCVGLGETFQCFNLREGAPAEPNDAELLATELDRPTRDACVALAVFTEARGEPELGQAAVAQTVVNRSKRLGVDECHVVTGLSQYHGVEQLKRDPWQIDQDAWDRALRISTAVAQGSVQTGACASATHFHADSVTPTWSRTLRLVCRVGGHSFYSET